MPIPMQQADNWGGWITPQPRLVDDARAVRAVVDGYRVPAQGRQRGEPLDQEIVEGARIWPGRVHPVWVPLEDSGFNAAAER